VGGACRRVGVGGTCGRPRRRRRFLRDRQIEDEDEDEDDYGERMEDEEDYGESGREVARVLLTVQGVTSSRPVHTREIPL
jgi:hypothetical protein